MAPPDLDTEDLLDEMREAGIACRRRHGLPQAGSQAALDVEREAMVAGNGWNDDPIRLSFSLAVTLLAAAEEHQLATVRLLRAKSAGVSVPVVGRAALEAASRGFWLTEPGVSLVERGARAWSIKLASWWWMAKQQPAEHDWWLSVGQRTIDVLAGAQARGLDFGLPRSFDNDAGAPFVGSRMGGSADMVDTLMPGIGRHLYRSMSGHAHGGVHSLDAGVTGGDPDDEGVSDRSIGLSYPNQVTYSIATTWGLLNYGRQLFEWAGWADAEWRSANERLGRAVADLFDAAVQEMQQSST